MKRLLILVMLFSLSTSGCADLLTRAVTGGPQQAQIKFEPTEKGVEGARGVLETAIPALEKTQVNKQDNITLVGKEMIGAMKEVQLNRPLTPAECKLYAYLGARLSNEIRVADGTTSALKDLGMTAPDFMHMSSQEAFWAGLGYQTYAMGRTATALAVQPQVRDFMEKGLDVGWQWTGKAIGTLAGGATGGVGLASLLGLFFNRARKRAKLLKSTGKTIENIPKDKAITGGELRKELAKGHSTVPVNAKKELGLPT